jgi:hypothetical protein
MSFYDSYAPNRLCIYFEFTPGEMYQVDLVADLTEEKVSWICGQPLDTKRYE